MKISSTTKITIVGLGYVGLPLAVALARRFDCTGLDINERRIQELREGHDRTTEVDAETLRASRLKLTSDAKDCMDSDIYIVTVPTPVDDDNKPDLKPVLSASRTVGGLLRAGRKAIIVYESTVYPGVTEDICGPVLEQVSGLAYGKDFHLGYSPERINPGDREHTVDRITKVIAGDSPETTEVLAEVYGSITSGGVFRAASIKVAEAAKVIENAQRDINIAFMNEIAMIFQKIGISAYDVLDAAATKWNFLKFSPGLVGGHCIGVDPYYLSHRAEELGHDPQVILAGRRINDSMGFYVADSISSKLPEKSSILVLGLTFKENVPDLRNSKVIDVVRRLKQLGHAVCIHDPLASPEEALHEYGENIIQSFEDLCADTPGGSKKRHDAVVAAVPHTVYAEMKADQIAGLLKQGGLIADLKGLWRGVAFDEGLKVWRL